MNATAFTQQVEAMSDRVQVNSLQAVRFLFWSVCE
jgi:hypothetical protein